MHLSIAEVVTLIVFIKKHERDEIPDDVWDLFMKMCNVEEEYPCNYCQEWDCDGCRYSKG